MTLDDFEFSQRHAACWL